MTTHTPLTVGLKYCGHCQPHRNMVELTGMIQAAAPDMRFVRWSEPEYDVLLLLQACDVACAEAPPVAAPLVEVVVSTLDFVEYETNEALVNAAIQALHQAGAS